MDKVLLELATNITVSAEQPPGHSSAPPLTWVNVAIASSFILVNGKK